MQSETLESIDQRSVVDTERSKQAAERADAGQRKGTATPSTKADVTATSSPSSVAPTGSSQTQFASEPASTPGESGGKKVDVYA